MVVDKGVTEIADSEEEPLTSSPAAGSDAAVDKLSATARQEDQDLACNHQEPAGYIANQASGRADRLDADHRKALTDSRSRLTGENDLQPAQQAEGATVNTCTAKDVTRAESRAESTLNQAIIEAVAMDRRDDCVAEHGAHGESRVISPDLEVAGRGDELCTPANVQAMINEAPYGQQSSHLPEFLPLAPNSSIQVSPSGVLSQQETRCDDTTTPGLVDGNQVGVQEDAVMESAQNSTEQANSEDAAESPGYYKAREAPVVSQSASAANDAGIYPSSDYTASRDAKVVESLDSETSPFAAADKVLSSAQEPPLKTSTAFPDLHPGVEAFVNILPEPTTDATAVSVPPSGDKANDDTNDHEFNHEDGLPVRSTTHDNAVHGETEHTRQQAKENADCGTAPKQLTVDEGNPDKTQAGLPAEPRSVIRSEETTSEPVAHESAVDVTLPNQDDAGTNSGQEMIPTQLESQRNSQSTASQPSEPVSPTKLTPQQVTLAELKAQKAALLASLKDLPAIQLLVEESQASDVDMSDDDGEPTEADITAAANKIVKEHIKLLHEYNELKDVGQGLMGLIADQRGVRIVEVQEEFGIDAND